MSRRGHVRLGTRFFAAFTLIELVVALAGVAVLLGLLIPTLHKATQASRGTQCMSNLRQLHAAAISYTAVNDERFPPALLYFKTAVGVDTVAWDFNQAADGVVRPGPVLERLDQHGEACQCPSFAGQSTFGTDPFTGYNYNTSYIGTEGFPPKPGPNGTLLDGWANARLGFPPGTIRRPDGTALFGDGGWAGGANKFMRAPMNTIEKNLAVVYSGGQDYRHAGCTNVVHIDGHCACVNRKHEGKLATPALLKTPLGWPQHAFLSNDDKAYDPR